MNDGHNGDEPLDIRSEVDQRQPESLRVLCFYTRCTLEAIDSKVARRPRTAINRQQVIDVN